MEFFSKFAPADVKAYDSAAKDILGDNAGAAGDVFKTAALSSGLHPAQFASLASALKAGNEAALAAQSEGFETALTAAWGAKRAGNTEMVERAAKLIAPDMPVDEVIKALVSVNPHGDPAQTVRQLDVLRMIGERLDEGVNDPVGDAALGGLQDEHKALKRKAIDAGGEKNMAASDRARLEQLQKDLSNVR